jgi:hypothetical protein
MHAHEFQGQKLVHDHQGGEQPHGYFEHPEDGSRATETRSTTPMADALAGVDKAQGSDLDTVDADRVARQVMSNQEAQRAARELTALRALAEAVRASLGAFSEGDVRALAVTAGELNDHDAECGAGEYLSEHQYEVLDKARELFGPASA